MRKLEYLIAFTIFTLVLVWQLDALNITIMEARNFVTAREMTQEGNYLLPTLNGEYRLQKPPLPTWLTVAVGEIVGYKGIGWLRLPAVLIGLLGIFFTMKIFRRLSGEFSDEILTGVVLLSSFYFFLTSRSGMWDMFAQAFMLGAIYYYMRLFLESRNAMKLGLLFGMFAAASFMSKGPVALYGLFLPFTIAFHWKFHRKIFYSKKHWLALGSGLIIAALLSAIWPVYVYFSDAGQAALDTIAKESANWSSYNTRPFYYYWSFFTQSGIWTVVSFAALLACIVDIKKVSEKTDLAFYFWWTIAVVVLLSIIPEKKSRYLLPVLFPLAMLVSRVVQESELNRFKISLKISQIITSVVVAGVGIVLLLNITPELRPFRLKWLSGLILIATGIFSFFQVIRDNYKLSMYTLAGGMMVIILFHIKSIGGVMDSQVAVRSFSAFQTDEQLKELPLYSLVDPRPEISWHLGRRAPVFPPTELPESANQIGILSFEGIAECMNEPEWSKWHLISEECFDQNPVQSLKKPNIALRRYLAIIELKTE